MSKAGALKFLTPRVRREAVDGDLRRVWAWALDTYGVSPPPFAADLEAPTIDAMAPGARARRPRAAVKAAWRAERSARWRRGMAEFGAGRWLAVQSVNKIGRMLPRAWRLRLFAWAKAALA